MNNRHENPTIYLICGPIGAGKTTYARQVAKEHHAIGFCEDEWLSQLFVPDAPEGLLNEPMPIIGAWANEKYQRCRVQIWLICQQLLAQGISVVLEGAAANKTQRDVIRQKASTYNVVFQLHYVTCNEQRRRERVLKRNKEQGDTYSLEVTPAMFEHVEHMFEPPQGSERQGAIVIET